MAGLAVERLRVAPICQLCGGAPGVARVGKLGEDAPEVGSTLVLVAGERPAFRQAGEILAAIVLAEPVELRRADRERGLEIGGGAACQLGPPVAGGAAPNERFRVTGVLVELVLDDLERTRQRRSLPPKPRNMSSRTCWSKRSCARLAAPPQTAAAVIATATNPRHFMAASHLLVHRVLCFTE